MKYFLKELNYIFHFPIFQAAIANGLKDSSEGEQANLRPPRPFGFSGLPSRPKKFSTFGKIGEAIKVVTRTAPQSSHPPRQCVD